MCKTILVNPLLDICEGDLEFRMVESLKGMTPEQKELAHQTVGMMQATYNQYIAIKNLVKSVEPKPEISHQENPDETTEP